MICTNFVFFSTLFLADRTNGRAYSTTFLSVCRLCATHVLLLNGSAYRKTL